MTLEQAATLFPGAATDVNGVVKHMLWLVEGAEAADDPEDETDRRILAARTLGALWCVAAARP